MYDVNYKHLISLGLSGYCMQMASQPGYDVVNMKEVLKIEWSFKFSLNQTQAGLVINSDSVCFGFKLFVHHCGTGLLAMYHFRCSRDRRLFRLTRQDISVGAHQD